MFTFYSNLHGKKLVMVSKLVSILHYSLNSISMLKNNYRRNSYVSYTCREKQLSNPNQPCTPRISVVVG